MPTSHRTDTDCRPVETQTSFSSVLKTGTFPNKTQAIIYPYIVGTPTPYCTRKVNDKIGAENILHCMKISKESIRIYLRTRQISKEFMLTSGEIEIVRKKLQGS